MKQPKLFSADLFRAFFTALALSAPLHADSWGELKPKLLNCKGNDIENAAVTIVVKVESVDSAGGWKSRVEYSIGEGRKMVFGDAPAMRFGCEGRCKAFLDDNANDYYLFLGLGGEQVSAVLDGSASVDLSGGLSIAETRNFDLACSGEFLPGRRGER